MVTAHLLRGRRACRQRHWAEPRCLIFKGRSPTTLDGTRQAGENLWATTTPASAAIGSLAARSACHSSNYGVVNCIRSGLGQARNLQIGRLEPGGLIWTSRPVAFLVATAQAGCEAATWLLPQLCAWICRKIPGNGDCSNPIGASASRDGYDILHIPWERCPARRQHGDCKGRGGFAGQACA